MTPELLRLVIGQTLLHSCMTSLRLAIQLYVLHLGGSAGEVGFLMALFATANIFLGLWFGRLVDRRGFHYPWRLGVVLGVLSTTACALLPNLAGMTLSALMAGASVGVVGMVAQRQAAHMSRDATHRGEVFGWVMLSTAAANVLGPMCAGLLLDHAGDSPADLRSLVVCCAFGALLALASLWLVKPVTGFPPVPSRKDAARGDRRALWKDARLRNVILQNSFAAACWDSFILLVPILGHERGLSASAIGTTLGAFAIAVAVSRPLLPRLAARLKTRTLVIAGSLLSGVLFALFPLLTSAWSFLVGAMLFGAALGGIQPLLLSTLTRISPPEQQGQVLGLRMMSVSACHSTVPLLFGSLGALVGVAVMFWASAAIAWGGASMAWRSRDEDG